MNPVMAAYLAGMLEVAGWVGSRQGQPGIEIVVSREVGQKIMNGIGFGTLNTRGQGKFAWAVNDIDLVGIIIDSISPYLSQGKLQEVTQVIINARAE